MHGTCMFDLGCTSEDCVGCMNLSLKRPAWYRSPRAALCRAALDAHEMPCGKHTTWIGGRRNLAGFLGLPYRSSILNTKQKIIANMSPITDIQQSAPFS
jgi:hypothetical protein